MATEAPRSIKVTEQAHWQLKKLAVKYKAHVWQVVDMAIVAFKAAERQNGKPKGNK